MIRRKTLALAAGLLLATATAANAVVLADKSPEQKLRADVAKQMASYFKCLVGVAAACEKTGVNLDIECNLETGVATPPADPKHTFAAAIAKCDAKLDFDKKGPEGNTSVQNYELLGCPRFDGGPRLADMNALEADAGPVLKQRVTGLVGNVDSASGCTDAKSCKADSKLIVDFYKGIVACQTACENDYKDKKGDGGSTDSLAQCTDSGDPKALICLAKVVDKFLDAAADWPLGGLAASLFLQEATDTTNDLFNRAADCN